ncbi:MAG: DNA mismatch repair endonuclease MutL [Planctomycetes bacterium]|nr:DNA mismatch repair endonuclease MutL [Planctomycetota bacterium]
METGCRIHVLPPLLVNKIAAGEVVERPASVVKELIDNAVDGGAGRIAVTIQDGGKQLIRVTDDGQGMSAEELRLAITPHATSKITAEEDLYAIGTLGFRGEALASISSVAKLRIVSRMPDALEGHEINVAGERVESSRSAGCPAGTTVEVRDLFFNVPARRRFLRANSTEVGHINEQFARAALAWPGIGFSLTNNDRCTHNLPPCKSRLERIAKFYSPELASALLHVEREERGVKINAYIAPPDRSRATAQWQYAYVNGRYVRDRYIQHAVKEAYRGLMEPNRHGVVFLFLSIAPTQIDVNVHPTKIEIRWADSNLIHSQVLSALRETFQRCDLTPALRTATAREAGTATISPQDQDRMRRELASMLKSASPVPPGSGGSHTGAPASDKPLFSPDRGAARPATGDPTQTWRSLYSPPAPHSADDVVDASRFSSVSGAMDGAPAPRVIQMHNLYLVAETEDGIVIVDQHAFHERVMYEELRRKLTDGPLESQRLLLPETLNLTGEQSALLTAHAELLEKLGIEITPFGHDAIAVHSFPALLKDVDVARFMRDLLDRLAEQPSASTEEVIHKVLDMMACKAAVKAGDVLTREEIDALMRKRHLIDKSTSCPHGRPTMLRLTKADLDRQFKRT